MTLSASQIGTCTLYPIVAWRNCIYDTILVEESIGYLPELLLLEYRRIGWRAQVC